MCDTQVIIKDNTTWFAKNSDREPGEPQLVVRLPATRKTRERKLKATYIEIDQVQKKHAVILSKPSWIWGAEIGANDAGVVIGNEALFSRVMESENGLLGMDLLRLGLERGDDAQHAMQVIIELLQKYGQGGAAGFRDKSLRYDNSFIIADAKESWVLETAGRHWVSKKIKTAWAISNCMTIEEDFDQKSKGIEDFAIKKGLLKKNKTFNFKKTFDTRFIPFFAGAHERLQLSNDCFNKNRQESKISLQNIANNLRAHHRDSKDIAAGSNKDICMHAGGFIRRSQTCGSMISKLSAISISSELSKSENLHFITGTSAPCLSIFKPVSFDFDLNFGVLNHDETEVENSLWKKHEDVHRRLLFLPEERKSFTEQLHQVEAKMVSIFEKPYHDITKEDFINADKIVMDFENQAILQYKNQTINYSLFNPYSRFWKQMNKLDGF